MADVFPRLKKTKKVQQSENNQETPLPIDTTPKKPRKKSTKPPPPTECIRFTPLPITKPQPVYHEPILTCVNYEDNDTVDEQPDDTQNDNLPSEIPELPENNLRQQEHIKIKYYSRQQPQYPQQRTQYTSGLSTNPFLL